MRPYRDSTPTKIALAVFFVIIIAYAYFEARGIIYGPQITIGQSIEQVSNPYVDLSGTTSHIASLAVNGQNVPVTEAGAFDIPYALSPGYNRIVLDARDKYGNSTEKVVQVVYTPATSTSARFIATTTRSTGSTNSPKAGSGQAVATSTLSNPSTSTAAH